MSTPRILLVVADETREMEAALRYAAFRAASTHSRVALLCVTPPTEMQLWRAVEKRIEEEAMRKSEALLQRLAGIAYEITGNPVAFYCAEGEVQRELVKLINADQGISVLILAAAKSGKGPGPLVNYFSGSGLSRMRIPFVIVPEDYMENSVKTAPMDA
jgi:nucleotide-binding universal stress UspA family protein